MLLRWCLLVWSSNWSSRCWLSRNVFISFFIAAFSVNSIIVAIRGVFRRSNVSQETRNTVDTVGTQWPPAPHNFDGVIGLFWTNYLLLRIFAIQHAINPSVKRTHDCMARFILGRWYGRTKQLCVTGNRWEKRNEPCHSISVPCLLTVN